MNIRPKLRNAALVGALAAITATAWATNEAMSDTASVPADSVTAQAPAAATAVEPVTVGDSLSPRETVVTSDGATVPVADRSIAQAPITVEQQRLSRDERIQSLVMDRLAASNLSGKIGVESHESVVTLSGWTTTAGQADRAGRYARGVMGVRYVQNEIRPRIGGSAS